MTASSRAARRGARRAATWIAGRVPFTVDAYRFARDHRGELALRADLRATKRATAFLRDEIRRRREGPTVLVASYRDNVFETKLDLLLASMLAVRGLRPVVYAPSRRAHRVRRYARAFSVERVVTRDDIDLTMAERADCSRARESLFGQELTFDRVRDWTFRGSAAGTHALSTLIRTTFDGAPDLSVERVRARLATIVDDVVVNVVRAERLLHELAPKVVLVEEANYSVNGPLVDAAVGAHVDVIQTVPTWRDDALVSKRLTPRTRRIDPKAVDEETLSWVRDSVAPSCRDAALENDFAERYGGRWALSRRIQPAAPAPSGDQLLDALGLDPCRRTAVVFGHVLWDASLFYGHDLFENYTDWLVHTVEAAIANSRVNWIVKTHPSNVYAVARGYAPADRSELAVLRARFPRLPDHVRVLEPDAGVSAWSLYEHADYAVTVRGTPGIEMACFGKPAFTAGTGTYAGRGFSYDSHTSQEYLGRLGTIESYGPLPAEMTERARWYAYALFVRRPWLAKSFTMAFDDDRHEELRRALIVNARSVGGLRSYGDLDEWADWVLESPSIDFVPARATQEQSA